MKTGSAPLTLAVLAVSNMPFAYLTVSISFSQFGFYPLSWLPSSNSKRPPLKTGSDSSLHPLSSRPPAQECFRTQTHATLCTNKKQTIFDKQHGSIRTSTAPEHWTREGLLQPVNPSKIHHCQSLLVKRLQFIMIAPLCH